MLDFEAFGFLSEQSVEVLGNLAAQHRKVVLRTPNEVKVEVEYATRCRPISHRRSIATVTQGPTHITTESAVYGHSPAVKATGPLPVISMGFAASRFQSFSRQRGRALPSFLCDPSGDLQKVLRLL